MPPSTRRSSLPSVTALPPDEISALSLAEVRARLERNERVLNSSIFSPPRSPSLPNIASSSTSPTPDPVREKLLVSRQQLLHREQELLMAQMDDGIEKMGVGSLAESSASARRRSRSGKVRALERIQAGEGRLAKNGVLLYVHLHRYRSLSGLNNQAHRGDAIPQRAGLIPSYRSIPCKHVTLPSPPISQYQTSFSPTTTRSRSRRERRDLPCSSCRSNACVHELQG